MDKTAIKKSNNNAFPIKLDDLKPHLQMEAFEQEISLHFLVRKILADHLIAAGKIKREDFYKKGIRLRIYS